MSQKTDLTVKNAELDAQMLNVTSTIERSDTNNVVVVATDVTLRLLFSNLFHPRTMFICVNLE